MPPKGTEIPGPLSIFSRALGRVGNLRNIPRYVEQYRTFESLGGRITDIYAILGDFDCSAGIARGHYFHQDLIVASFINERKPVRHIDIGSRIDGFVAHVASFRKIELMDIRELGETGHPNIVFFKGDLMSDALALESVTDSLSCLHAIEHFGLGRYGDTIDPIGHRKGFKNLMKMLEPGGTLYISFPIGRSNEVHFNAHRVFRPTEIFSWAKPEDLLRLVRFDFVDDDGALHRNADPADPALSVTHGCGIYTFKKLPLA